MATAPDDVSRFILQLKAALEGRLKVSAIYYILSVVDTSKYTKYIIYIYVYIYNTNFDTSIMYLITYLVLSIHIIITHLYANLVFPDFDAYNNISKRAASRSVYASNNLGSELNSNNRKPATKTI